MELTTLLQQPEKVVFVRSDSERIGQEALRQDVTLVNYGNEPVIEGEQEVIKQIKYKGLRSMRAKKHLPREHDHRQTRHKYDVDAIISHRYPIQANNRAIQAMQACQEIKPLVLPHA